MRAREVSFLAGHDWTDIPPSREGHPTCPVAASPASPWACCRGSPSWPGKIESGRGCTAAASLLGATNGSLIGRVEGRSAPDEKNQRVPATLP